MRFYAKYGRAKINKVMWWVRLDLISYKYIYDEDWRRRWGRLYIHREVLGSVRMYTLDLWLQFLFSFYNLYKIHGGKHYKNFSFEWDGISRYQLNLNPWLRCVELLSNVRSSFWKSPTTFITGQLLAIIPTTSCEWVTKSTCFQINTAICHFWQVN